MNLLMSGDLAAGYTSRSQQARVVSEAWAQRELYCANCDSPALTGMPNNYRAADLKCPVCTIPFQLKAKTGVIGRTIADGAYGAMLSAIRSDQSPNLLLLRYVPESWTVRDLLLIPSFAFPESSIVKRKPLAVTAKRAGWIGCNIALGLIPQDARIPIIKEGITVPTAKVRASYAKVKPLREIKATERGWTLDVLNAVRRLGKSAFSTSDAYSFEGELQSLHPRNRHVREKIRQQLQVLRDLGLLAHVSRSRWRAVPPQESD